GAGAAASQAVPRVGDPAAQERITQLLQRLQTDKDGKRIGPELRPYSRYVAPTLVGYLKDFPMRKAAEEALLALEPRETAPLLVAALRRETDAQAQVPIIRVLGKLDDNSAVPPLRDFLKSDQKDVRFYAADALVHLRAKEGIPVLIEFLKSSEETKGVIAYDTLKSATGYSFGYKYWGKPEEKEEAARRWEEWWSNSGAAFQFK
ncbi:MAG: HEAT repeat domain-containing protein, partial [Planctomycetes bacterium]|nr:HEAT repeat domain-containing protein [Planctomycetota bacterium]